MPQMAPINWLILFMIFSLSFLIFNMMNYFLYLPCMPKSILNYNKINTSFNWKW